MKKLLTVKSKFSYKLGLKTQEAKVWDLHWCDWYQLRMDCQYCQRIKQKRLKRHYDLSPNASSPNQVCLMQVRLMYKFANFDEREHAFVDAVMCVVVTRLCMRAAPQGLVNDRSPAGLG